MEEWQTGLSTENVCWKEENCSWTAIWQDTFCTVRAGTMHTVYLKHRRMKKRIRCPFMCTMKAGEGLTAEWMSLWPFVLMMMRGCLLPMILSLKTPLLSVPPTMCTLTCQEKMQETRSFKYIQIKGPAETKKACRAAERKM